MVFDRLNSHKKGSVYSWLWIQILVVALHHYSPPYINVEGSIIQLRCGPKRVRNRLYTDPFLKIPGSFESPESQLANHPGIIKNGSGYSRLRTRFLSQRNLIVLPPPHYIMLLSCRIFTSWFWSESNVRYKRVFNAVKMWKGHISRSTEPFLMLPGWFESGDCGLSNLPGIIKRGSVEIEIWSFQVYTMLQTIL